jgi:hypothetical protein
MSSDMNTEVELDAISNADERSADKSETEIDDQPAETEIDDQPVETETDDQPVETETDDQPVETETDDQPVETETDDQPVETETDDQLTYHFCVGNNVENLHTNWYGTLDLAINNCAACEYCYQHMPDKSIFYGVVSATPLKLKCNYYNKKFYEILTPEYKVFMRCELTICWLNRVKDDYFEVEALPNSSISVHVKMEQTDVIYKFSINGGTKIRMTNTNSKIEFPMELQNDPMDIKLNIKYGTTTDDITFRVIPIDPAKYAVKVRTMI